MAKGARKGVKKRREEEEELQDSNETSVADRPERQRKSTIEERRAKQRCVICGQLGHIRRLCPGIPEDTSKKTSKAGKGKQKAEEKKIEDDIELPEGFSNINVTDEAENEEVGGNSGENQRAIPEPFLYYDAGCDSMATLEYVRQGRCKFPISYKAAVAEYQQVIDKAASSSNFGGRISRSLIKKNRPWSLGSESPLENDAVWFVLGLDIHFLYNDRETDAAISSLLEALSENETVTGFFSDLDYSPEVLSREGCDRGSQIRRLHATCQAAFKAEVAIQIRISPAAATSRSAQSQAGPDAFLEYRKVMEDLELFLTETIANMPSLKVHLSCWAGDADDMTRLLRKFPENIWVGMDASVTFAKVSRAHECAFELPLSRLLMETGTPTTIPSPISKAKGRTAFCHSGLIPFIAEAISEFKCGSADISAIDVARAASVNTVLLYPELAKVV